MGIKQLNEKYLHKRMGEDNVAIQTNICIKC